MTTSTDISRRFWNLPQKPGEETAREQSFIDDIIQKTHIQRLLLENLSGVHSVFDGGAGYGRFSILLAKRGLKVTHFDISEGMIAKAKQIAGQEGVLDNMTFIHGALEDLSAFKDRQFDLVMSFDAPISYTYPNHEEVFENLIRIAGKKICVGVYSRMGQATYLLNPIQKDKYIIDKASNAPLVQWYIEFERKMKDGFVPDMNLVRDFAASGLMDKPEDTAAAYESGGSPWPISYAFMPDELKGLLERFGAKDVHLSGPGALSRCVSGEVLRHMMKDEAARQAFLDFSFWYDSQPWCAGMGKDNLVAIADV